MTKSDEPVYHETIDNLDVVVRYPMNGDAKAMCNYINVLSKEKTYITWQGEKLKLEDEEKYLIKQLENIKNNETAQLLLFVNEELTGISSVDLGSKVHSHIGTFGISILKEYRGKGLGKLLMKHVLEEALKNLTKLKIITLEVFAENEKAIIMYKNFGFIEYGRLPNGNKYKGKLVDDILMYKNA